MSGFVRVGAAGEVPEGAARRYVVDGVPIAVYRCKGRLLATHDRCTHAEASLADGFLDCEEGTVECPLHGARFDIASGKALSLPAVVPVKTFAVKEEGGGLLIAM